MLISYVCPNIVTTKRIHLFKSIILPWIPKLLLWSESIANSSNAPAIWSNYRTRTSIPPFVCVELYFVHVCLRTKQFIQPIEWCRLSWSWFLLLLLFFSSSTIYRYKFACGEEVNCRSSTFVHITTQRSKFSSRTSYALMIASCTRISRGDRFAIRWRFCSSRRNEHSFSLYSYHSRYAWSKAIAIFVDFETHSSITRVYCT